MKIYNSKKKRLVLFNEGEVLDSFFSKIILLYNINHYLLNDV